MKAFYKKIIWLLIVTEVMLVIYGFSSQTAIESKVLSNHFIGVYEKSIQAVPFIPRAAKMTLLSKPGHYVRKAAHMCIYCLLGIVTFIALWQTTLRKSLCIICALLICMIYAATDEWHQYYVAGRGAQVSDVILDTIGALIGILMAAFISWIIRCISDRIRNDIK